MNEKVLKTLEYYKIIKMLENLIFILHRIKSLEFSM